MSVIVKGIDMPKNCSECPFLYDDDACYAMNKSGGWFLPLVCNGTQEAVIFMKYLYDMFTEGEKKDETERSS